jgi:diguanylate cyclase (GGDEF)-like protein
MNDQTPTRLLIVDDDDVDREKINRCLNKITIPITIVAATNGTDAIRQAIEHNVDLILLDYNLGDMTGTEFLVELKNHVENDIPTIMITGQGNEHCAVEAMKLGAIDYLSKDTLSESILVPVIRTAIEKHDLEIRYKRSQEELERKSLYDSLTGVSNRELTFDRINQYIAHSERRHTSFYVLVLDLNGFKEINDTFGHLAGDEVLKQTSDRMAQSCRKTDTIGRFGGDEFIIIFSDVKDDNALKPLLDKILSQIAIPISINNQLITVGASIGISQYPRNGSDRQSLLSTADDAMYQAKRNNQSYVFYSGKSSHGQASFINTQSILQGIENNEFYLVYQPKIDLKSNTLHSVETLIRWQNPMFGLVMPNDFIPYAERSNAISFITQEVIRIALKQAREWQEANQLTFDISLNISAKTLDVPSFREQLLESIKVYDINPKNIILEITETALASSRSEAQYVLSTLINDGFQISIDDFGTGFTSFRYIRDIEIAEIKIDRLFIKGINRGSRDLQIVHSIISLAENLGIRTVAEGVETIQQRKLLEEIGCNSVQGFGVAKPMLASQLIDWDNDRKKAY